MLVGTWHLHTNLLFFSENTLLYFSHFPLVNANNFKMGLIIFQNCSLAGWWWSSECIFDDGGKRWECLSLFYLDNKLDLQKFSTYLGVRKNYSIHTCTLSLHQTTPDDLVKEIHTSDRVKIWVSEWVSEWVNESVSKTLSDRVGQWLSKRLLCKKVEIRLSPKGPYSFVVCCICKVINHICQYLYIYINTKFCYENILKTYWKYRGTHVCCHRPSGVWKLVTAITRSPLLSLGNSKATNVNTPCGPGETPIGFQDLLYLGDLRLLQAKDPL